MVKLVSPAEAFKRGLRGGNVLSKNIEDRRGSFSHFRNVNSDPNTRDPASILGDFTFNPEFGRNSPMSPAHPVLPYEGVGSAFVPDINRTTWDEPEIESKLNFYAQPKSYVSDEQASTRALKMAFGLGMDPSGAKDEILNGREDVLREGVAKEASIAEERERLQLIKTVTQALEGPPDISTASIIDALTYGKETNPRTYPETAYIDKVMSELYFNTDQPDSLYKRASDEDVLVSASMYDVMSDNMAKMEVGKKIYEDLGGTWKDTSLGVKIGDFVEGFIPFVNWSTISDDTEFGDMLGTSKRADVQALWALPTVNEFEAALSVRVKELAKSNLFAAYDFLKAVFSYGSSDEFFDNFMSGLDVLSTPGIGLGTRVGVNAMRSGKAIQATRDLGKALAKTAKVVSKPKVDIPDILSSAGKTEKAAKVTVHNNLADEFYRQRDAVVSGVIPSDQKAFQSVTSHMPSLMDPYRHLKGHFKLDREVADRIFDRVAYHTMNILKNVTARNSLTRLPAQAEAALVDSMAIQARKDFPTASNAVMDIEYIPADKTLTNVPSMSVKLKTPWGDPFHVRENAEHFAKTEYQLKEYKIEQQGDGYYIDVGIRDLDETNPSVRDHLIETGNETPDSMVNMFLGGARGADNLLSPHQRAARKRAVHGKQEMIFIAKELAKDIAKLHGKSKKDFERFTVLMRDKPRKDVNGKTVRGEFFDGLADFEIAWQDAFKRLPTEKEAKAYFAYVKFHQWDLLLKNVATYRAKAREGLRLVTLRPEKGTAGEALTSKPPAMPEFEAKILDPSDFEKLLNEKGNRGFLAWDPEQGYKEFFSKGKLKESKDVREAFLASLQNNGYQIVQIANPFLRPLKEVAGDSHIIDYVITKSYDTKRVPLNQVPYSPGGSVGYQYNWFIKQAKVSNVMERVLYFGDQTLRPAETRAKAQRLVKSYEEARKLFNDYRAAVRRKKGASTELKAFEDFVNGNLAETPTKLITMFRSGQINPDQAVTLVRSGTLSIDDQAYKQGLGDFENVFESPENLTRSIDSQYAGERGFDLSGIEEGTEQNPLLNLQSPKLIDPLSMIDRSITRQINNHFFQDYRTLAVEQFIEEFSDVLGVSKDVLRSNPLAFFYKPIWNKTADESKRKAAELFLATTREMLGVRTQTQKTIGYVKEKLYESVFEKYGDKTSDMLNDWALSSIGDPIAGIRAAVFHTRLGLFSLPQVIRQAMTVTHVLAISPVNGMRGLGAYTPMRLALQNEQWTDHIAKSVKLAGWTEDEFKEAADFLRRSGIMHVEGEHIWKDDLKDKLVRGPMGKFLDFGQIFFREGERISRITAFNTAYLDWRRANPGKKLTRRDEDMILLRQDTMNVNMTQASRANWQKGLLNIPTQFLSYQIRLWEQMMGKQLTTAEKARVFGMYSAMFGVPVAAGGLYAPVWPWYEEYRQDMLEEGWDWDDTANEIFHTGLLQTMLHLITGAETDAGEQLGPAGINIFKDIVSGDPSKTVLSILMGPSGQTVDQFWDGMYPIFKDFRAVFSEGVDGDLLNVTANDFNDALRGISSWNYANKMYAGLMYGRFLTKNEEYIGDVDSVESILMGTLGLNPRDIDDVYRWFESNRDKTNYQKDVKKEIIKYLRRGIKAKDRKEQLAYYKQAKVWVDLGDFRPDEYMDIFREAAAGWESTLEEINRRMLLEKAPPSQSKQRYERYKKDR